MIPCSRWGQAALPPPPCPLPSQVDAALSALHLPATSRAQELTLQHFVDLHVLLHDSKAAALMEAARSGEEAEEREEAKEGEGGEDSDV